MPDDEPSLNIPSLLTLAVVSFFVIRWFLNRDNGNGSASTAGRSRGRQIDPAQVEQISQMFPQLDRRDIMWDLHRNGGSVTATTERILSGLGLDRAPPSFQPQIPQASPAETSRTTTQSQSSLKITTPNLITRYNLTSRLSEEPTTDGEQSSQPASGGWSQNKIERQRMLQKRRDDMILAARRRLQQKEREAASHTTSPAL